MPGELEDACIYGLKQIDQDYAQWDRREEILCHVHSGDENHQDADISGDIKPTADLQGARYTQRALSFSLKIAKQRYARLMAQRAKGFNPI